LNITRTWAFPKPDTFKCSPINDFVKKYLKDGMISIDPFARNSTLCTYTNDLNPDTKAQYHVDCNEFLKILDRKHIIADLGILDPPYSTRQMHEIYQKVGRKTSIEDSQGVGIYKHTRTALDRLIRLGGIVLSFGWNSIGMGINRKYEIIEILLVCHGGMHNDTICMAERKIAEQGKLDL
jgi:hypothetical protein